MGIPRSIKVLSSPQSRVPRSPLPMGHKTRPLLRRPRQLEPLKDPRHRHVAPSPPSLPTAIMVRIPQLLDALALADPHEPMVRPRRALDGPILYLESAAGEGASGVVDEFEGVFFLQYRDCVAGGAREGCWEGADGSCAGAGGQGGGLGIFRE